VRGSIKQRLFYDKEKQKYNNVEVEGLGLAEIIILQSKVALS